MRLGANSSLTWSASVKVGWAPLPSCHPRFMLLYLGLRSRSHAEVQI